MGGRESLPERFKDRLGGYKSSLPSVKALYMRISKRTLTSCSPVVVLSRKTWTMVETTPRTLVGSCFWTWEMEEIRSRAQA
jgi:hypothetical protein